MFTSWTELIKINSRKYIVEETKFIIDSLLLTDCPAAIIIPGFGLLNLQANINLLIYILGCSIVNPLSTG